MTGMKDGWMGERKEDNERKKEGTRNKRLLQYVLISLADNLHSKLRD